MTAPVTYITVDAGRNATAIVFESKTRKMTAHLTLDQMHELRNVLTESIEYMEASGITERVLRTLQTRDTGRDAS